MTLSSPNADIGEIASYEQFFLFPQCFRKTCTADTQKLGFVWEMVKCLISLINS